MKDYHYNSSGFTRGVLYFRSRITSRRIVVGVDEVVSNQDGILALKTGYRFQITSRYPERVEQVSGRLIEGTVS